MEEGPTTAHSSGEVRPDPPGPRGALNALDPDFPQSARTLRIPSRMIPSRAPLERPESPARAPSPVLLRDGRIRVGVGTGGPRREPSGGRGREEPLGRAGGGAGGGFGVGWGGVEWSGGQPDSPAGSGRSGCGYRGAERAHRIPGAWSAGSPAGAAPIPAGRPEARPGARVGRCPSWRRRPGAAQARSSGPSPASRCPVPTRAPIHAQAQARTPPAPRGPLGHLARGAGTGAHGLGRTDWGDGSGRTDRGARIGSGRADRPGHPGPWRAPSRRCRRWTRTWPS